MHFFFFKKFQFNNYRYKQENIYSSTIRYINDLNGFKLTIKITVELHIGTIDINSNR